MLDVCSPYMTEPCPKDNATAYELMGAPFIEVYESCSPVTARAFLSSPLGWEALLVLLALVAFAGLLARKHAGDRSRDYQAFEDSEAGCRL